jgi:hypothetical protein
MVFSWGRTRRGDKERIHVMSNYDAEHFTLILIGIWARGDWKGFGIDYFASGICR